MMQVRLQLEFFMTQVVQMLSQVGDVGFEHHVDVRARGGLFLQKFPLGFQHFVLLFQESYLLRKMTIKVENENMKPFYIFYIDICLGSWYFYCINGGMVGGRGVGGGGMHERLKENV